MLFATCVRREKIEEEKKNHTRIRPDKKRGALKPNKAILIE